MWRVKGQAGGLSYIARHENTMAGTHQPDSANTPSAGLTLPIKVHQAQPEGHHRQNQRLVTAPICFHEIRRKGANR